MDQFLWVSLSTFQFIYVSRISLGGVLSLLLSLSFSRSPSLTHPVFNLCVCVCASLRLFQYPSVSLFLSLWYSLYHLFLSPMASQKGKMLFLREHSFSFISSLKSISLQVHKRLMISHPEPGLGYRQSCFFLSRWQAQSPRSMNVSGFQKKCLRPSKMISSKIWKVKPQNQN